MEYVLGFAFNEDNSKVALIRKNRPQWQAGKLNGIGGKIEETDDTYENAMHREFYEETGLKDLKWNYKGYMSNDDWSVELFASYNNDLSNIKSITDEDVIVCDVIDILLDKHKIISNLKWLISYCLDEDAMNNKTLIGVNYYNN